MTAHTEFLKMSSSPNTECAENLAERIFEMGVFGIVRSRYPNFDLEFGGPSNTQYIPLGSIDGLAASIRLTPGSFHQKIEINWGAIT